MKAWIPSAILITFIACVTPSGGGPSEDALAPTMADALAQLEAAGPPSDTEVPAPWHRRAASTFVPASPDTRSRQDIDAAACGWPGLGGSPLFNLGATVGFVYLDSPFAVAAGLVTLSTAVYSGCVIYGSGTNTINMQGSSHLWNSTGNNFQSTLTAPGLVTGIQLNGTATGNSNCALTFHAGITTTPSHLDAACGAAGFGSNAFNFGGASVANF